MVLEMMTISMVLEALVMTRSKKVSDTTTGDLHSLPPPSYATYGNTRALPCLLLHKMHAYIQLCRTRPESVDVSSGQDDSRHPLTLFGLLMLLTFIHDKHIYT
jgi:hypothetical protein